MLYANDAKNVATTLWSSAMNSTRDSAGPSVKFGVPTVVNGKVYVGSNNAVMVYGLPDFALSSASSVAVTQGQSANTSINIVPQVGFSGTVSLSASNLPGGLTATFTTGTAGTPSVATFTAGNAALGNYQVLITGVSGAQTHFITVNVTVAPAPNFTLAASPAALNLAAGNSGTAKITVTPNQTFNGNVTFSCSVASSLANVTCSIPGTVPGGSGSVTLTVAAATTALMPLPHNRRFPSNYLGAFFLFAALTLVGWTRAVKRLRAVSALACGFCLLLLMALSSCHGGSSASLSTGSVAESGLVTVVGSSGSVTNSATVSVTIQ